MDGQYQTLDPNVTYTHYFGGRMKMTRLLLDDTQDDLSETLEGETIIVSVAHIPPVLIIDRYSNGSILSISGYLADMWFILERELKFKTVLLDAGSEFLGSLGENGTWDGMIGALQSQRADVGLCALGITQSRKRVVDFSAPIMHDASRPLMFLQNRFENVDWLSFTATLSSQTWYCIGAMWVIAFLSLGYISRNENKSSYFDYAFSLFGALTMQGCEISPNRWVGRLSFISFWLMCLTLYASYTAHLTTRLATVTYRPLGSLREALEKGFRVSVIKGTMQHLGFVEASDINEDFKKIVLMLEEDPQLFVRSVHSGIESTYDQKTMFLFDFSSVYDTTANNCSLEFQPFFLFSGYLHLGYRKNFPLSESLDKKLIQLMSTGIQQKLANKWLFSSQLCVPVKDQTPSLGLSKTLFIFMIVIGGAISSFIILLIEFFIFKWKVYMQDRNHSRIRHLKQDSKKYSRSRFDSYSDYINVIKRRDHRYDDDLSRYFY